MYLEDPPRRHLAIPGAADPSAEREHWWPSLADPRKRATFTSVTANPSLAFGRPHPALLPYVFQYTGIATVGDAAGLPSVQRVPPECAVMLTISLSDSRRGSVTGADGTRELPGAGLTGLHERFYLIEYTARRGGVLLVAFTPPGAYALFGVAMREVANDHVALVDLLGRRPADRLVDELVSAPTWHHRFAVLDRVLTARVSRGREPDGLLLRAWEELGRCQGQVRIGRLAEELGCSRRYLEKRFGEQVGLTPKTVARVWRFQRATHLLMGPGAPTWREVAHTCGYTDQAHLAKDFRILAGCTPTQLLGLHPHRPDRGRSHFAKGGPDERR
ncbi:helix-turn-helix transcriptional regulator [Streptomyces sp. PTM05]|uniref:Helix-turn-helix transcriptional regulator n=1 Tax=Streptantibioticus parmotrematis TaxID=2873249 RepID=A0ABS7QR50_9ACTN|nr:helix-turn-helix transcriptional regulator [Streptantibioticus parmotrematis]MBY8885226.1 helix-turn-helix transcriptional regulator [Streptantibioticus parmotrematis]